MFSTQLPAVHLILDRIADEASMLLIRSLIAFIKYIFCCELLTAHHC